MTLRFIHNKSKLIIANVDYMKSMDNMFCFVCECAPITDANADATVAM